MNSLDKLNIKIFADGASFEDMINMNENSIIKGLTTNPSLMKKAGITNYEDFAKKVTREIKKKTISFEVFSDDFDEMEKQAEKISTWGNNVYAKIPITNTKKESACELIKVLNEKKIKVNVTAIMTLQQVEDVYKVLNNSVNNYVSIFAGRIADTGINPEIIISESLKIFKDFKKTEILWASCREIFNIYQADKMGCHIITVPNDILKKTNVVDYNLEKYSLDTVKDFYKDSVEAGYKL
jgi:transaldolase|tara:strand:+ start:128 stop:844 length:717 start_codon:yes stop_codon:yes gene_type:complete